MTIDTEKALPRSLRIAAYLAILFGFLGAFAGLSGAATYVPYRVSDGLTIPTAQLLTAISAVGAVVSALGMYAGWALLRARTRARELCLGVAVGCVATVAALATAMPAASPSPVPGGAGVGVLLFVVSVAYGLEALLLIFGRRAHDARAARGSLRPRPDQPA